MDTIGVNLLWLEPGVVGGSEEYTLGLLRALHELDPTDLELRLFVGARLLEVHPDLGQRFETVVAPPNPGGRPGRVFLETTWLRRHVEDLAVIHHAGGTVPFAGGAPVALTILDLQPLDHPEYFAPAKRLWLRRMLPRSAARADVLAVPSRFTAGRARQLLGVSPERIRVVPSGPARRSSAGVGPPDGSPGDVAPGTSAEAGNPYFVYPAITYPHKRHLDLVEAFHAVRARHPTARLVLTGRRGPLSDRLTAAIAELGLVDAVDVLGRIDRGRLDELISGATAVVIPSEYEGFGLPALEAMAAGTPLICAEAGSLPEVVGDAAVLVPERSANALADAMDRLVRDGGLRQRLAARGIERASTFSWDRAATALAQVYRDALG